MYVNVSNELQKKIIYLALKKAGSERKLRTDTGIPLISIYNYKNNLHRFTYTKFIILVNYVKIDLSTIDFTLISPQTFQSQGGKAVYAKHIKNNSFQLIHKKMRLASSERMKKWHKTMRENNTKEYYRIQHSRFKRVSDKKLKTLNGEFVRNWLELYFANQLFNEGISYEYEPKLICNNKTYFPDFKVKNIIIECTYWKGVSKAQSLKIKIQDYEKENFQAFVLIPKRLESFYKCIQDKIIMTECSP